MNALTLYVHGSLITLFACNRSSQVCAAVIGFFSGDNMLTLRLTGYIAG